MVSSTEEFFESAPLILPDIGVLLRGWTSRMNGLLLFLDNATRKPCAGGWT